MGQLLPHGASRVLIDAVKSADDVRITQELLKISNLEERDRLTAIVQRLGVLLGKKR